MGLRYYWAWASVFGPMSRELVIEFLFYFIFLRMLQSPLLLGISSSKLDSLTRMEIAIFLVNQISYRCDLGIDGIMIKIMDLSWYNSPTNGALSWSTEKTIQQRYMSYREMISKGICDDLNRTSFAVVQILSRVKWFISLVARGSYNSLTSCCRTFLTWRRFLVTFNLMVRKG